MGFKNSLKKAFLQPHSAVGFNVRSVDQVLYEEEERRIRHEERVQLERAREQARRKEKWAFGEPEEGRELDYQRDWDYFRDTEDGRQQVKDAEERERLASGGETDKSQASTP